MTVEASLENLKSKKVKYLYELFGNRYVIAKDKFKTVLNDYTNNSDLWFFQTWAEKLTKQTLINFKDKINIVADGYIADRKDKHAVIESFLLTFNDKGVLQVDFINGSEEGDVFLIKDSEQVDQLFNSYSADQGLGFAVMPRKFLGV